MDDSVVVYNHKEAIDIATAIINNVIANLPNEYYSKVVPEENRGKLDAVLTSLWELKQPMNL